MHTNVGNYHTLYEFIVACGRKTVIKYRPCWAAPFVVLDSSFQSTERQLYAFAKAPQLAYPTFVMSVSRTRIQVTNFVHVMTKFGSP